MWPTIDLVQITNFAFRLFVHQEPFQLVVLEYPRVFLDFFQRQSLARVQNEDLSSCQPPLAVGKSRMMSYLVNEVCGLRTHK